MTPGEILTVIQGHQRQQMAAAWWGEYFARQERLEPLTSYLEPQKRQMSGIETRMTWCGRQ